MQNSCIRISDAQFLAEKALFCPVIFLAGLGGSGKTVLSNEIASQLESKSGKSDGIITIRLNEKCTIHQFCMDIASVLKHCLNCSTVTSGSLSVLLHSLDRPGVILQIEDFHHLCENDSTLILKELVILKKTRIIITSRIRPVFNNSYEEKIYFHQVSGLDEAQSFQMLQDIFTQAGFNPDQQLMHKIFCTAGGNPFLMKITSSMLIRNKISTADLCLKDHQILKFAESSLAPLISSLDPECQYVLKLLAHSRISLSDDFLNPRYKNTVVKLDNMCFLERKNGKVHLQGIIRDIISSASDAYEARKIRNDLASRFIESCTADPSEIIELFNIYHSLENRSGMIQALEMLMKTVLFFSEGSLQCADVFHQAEKLEIFPVKAVFYRIICLIQSGELKQAISFLPVVSGFYRSLTEILIREQEEGCSEQLCHDFEALLSVCPEHDLITALKLMLAMRCGYIGDFKKADILYQEYRSGINSENDIILEALYYGNLATTLYFSGEMGDLFFQTCKRADELMNRLNLKKHVAKKTYYRGAALLNSGHPQEAEKCILAGVEELRIYGDRYWLGELYSLLGNCLEELDRLDEALTYHRKALQLFDFCDLLYRHAYDCAHIARISIRLHDYKSAEDQIALAFQYLKNCNFSTYHAAVVSSQAALLIINGKAEEAATCCRNILEMKLMPEMRKLILFYLIKSLEFTGSPDISQYRESFDDLRFIRNLIKYDWFEDFAAELKSSVTVRMRGKSFHVSSDDKTVLSPESFDLFIDFTKEEAFAIGKEIKLFRQKISVEFLRQLAKSADLSFDAVFVFCQLKKRSFNHDKDTVHLHTCIFRLRKSLCSSDQQRFIVKSDGALQFKLRPDINFCFIYQ